MYRMQRPNIRQLTLALYDEERKKKFSYFLFPLAAYLTLSYTLWLTSKLAHTP